MVRNLITSNLIIGLLLMVTVESNAQDSIVLVEVHTYYHDGTLKSVEKNKYNNGDLVCFSMYQSYFNSLYIHTIFYDSLHRPIKEESIEGNRIHDSTIYQYSPDGIKTEIRWIPDYDDDWTVKKQIIRYDENELPVNEVWYDILVLKNGDTLTTLVLETRNFYDKNQRIIIDSTFEGSNSRSLSPMLFDGEYISREKLNSATVTKYTYDGNFLVSSERIDEYGFIQIENHIRNENEDYIRHEQISISQNDTNSLITYYSYETINGQKVQTSETHGGFGSSFSRIYFDNKDNSVKNESLDSDGKVISMTEYYYDDLGYLEETIYNYLLDQRPINSLSNEPMGYRSVFFFV